MEISCHIIKEILISIFSRIIFTVRLCNKQNKKCGKKHQLTEHHHPPKKNKVKIRKNISEINVQNVIKNNI